MQDPRGWRYSSLANITTSYRATPLPLFHPSSSRRPGSSFFLSRIRSVVFVRCFSLAFHLRRPALDTVNPPAEHGIFLDRSHHHHHQPTRPLAPPPVTLVTVKRVFLPFLFFYDTYISLLPCTACFDLDVSPANPLEKCNKTIMQVIPRPNITRS